MNPCIANGARSRLIVTVLVSTIAALAAWSALAATSAKAAPSVPEMAIDINPGPSGSEPYSMMPFKDSLIFFAKDGKHGFEPWRLAGGKAQMIKDIRPGPLSSAGFGFTVAGNYAYFTADDGAHGIELWRTDGTPSGTIMLKDINPGETPSYPYLMLDLNGTLLFQANDAANNNELWRSDGTPAGTVMVKEINGGGSADINSLVKWNGLAYFTAYDGVSRQIWKSDGTQAGTELAVPAPPYTQPSSLEPAGNRLYFQASSGDGYELWKLEGGAPTQVKDINPGVNSSYPQSMVVFGDQAYFAARTDATGEELWRTDGTDAGTVMVKDIQPGALSSGPWGFTKFGPHIYFSAQTDAYGGEVWRTDGTTAGTVLVKDVNPGKSPGWPYSFSEVGGQLYFIADSATYGYELWKTDGSTTTLAKDILPGDDGQDEIELTPFGGTIYFSADDGMHGAELWRLGEPKSSAPAKLTLPSGKLKLDAKNRIKLKLTCATTDKSEVCDGRIKLATARKVAIGGKKGKVRKRKVTLVNKPFAVAGGKTKTVTIKLKKSVVRLLRSNAAARKVKVTAMRQGKPTASRTLTIKLPRLG